MRASLELAALLDVDRFEPLVMPFYSFTALKPELDLQAAWSGPRPRKLAVFTSPRAVEFGLPYIPAADINEIEFAAIGPATASKLAAQGHEVQLKARSGYTSEDLLQMPELAKTPGEAIIFCAPDGRKALKEGLQTLGWAVNLAMVYQRQAIHPSADQLAELANAHRLISVWTSVSALKLAGEFLPANLWEKILHAPVLVISIRIQHYLQQRGASHVELADGPGNNELLRSILRLGDSDWN